MVVVIVKKRRNVVKHHDKLKVDLPLRSPLPQHCRYFADPMKDSISIQPLTRTSEAGEFIS